VPVRQGQEAAQTKANKNESMSSVQTTLPPYLIKKIEALPDGERAECKAEFEAADKWGAAFETEVLTLARIQTGQMKDNICRKHGLQSTSPDSSIP
jgi:hypothetical protein